MAGKRAKSDKGKHPLSRESPKTKPAPSPHRDRDYTSQHARRHGLPVELRFPTRSPDSGPTSLASGGSRVSAGVGCVSARPASPSSLRVRYHRPLVNNEDYDFSSHSSLPVLLTAKSLRLGRAGRRRVSLASLSQ